ncbi:MAG TPA: hypothetical protein VEW28_01710 [Candidatus Kapabacteria bacterium]|nr:hypothetical protein [Candidatus Kapabacteria bacterium]
MNSLLKTLRDIFAVLQYVGFLFVILATGYFAFAGTPQSNDIFRAMGDGETFNIFFVVFVAVWSITVWYSARLMLQEFGKTSAEAVLAKKLITWMPRVLGLVPYVIILAAFLPYVSHGSVWWKMLLISGFAVIYFIIVTERRKIFSSRFTEHGKLRSASTTGTIHPIIKWRVTLVASISVVAAMTIFSIRPVAIPFSRYLTPAAIIALALGTWTAFGMLVYYWSFKLKIPIFVCAFIIVAIFSIFNSNHLIRTAGESSSSLVTKRPTLGEYFIRWAHKHQSDSGNVPLYIFAAEGGGIRAMLWTGEVLERFDSLDKNFYSHLFAITSASGGSVGSVFFNAYKQFYPVDDASTRTQLRSALHGDFLSPVTAAFVYPDFLDRLLPHGFNSLDRARWLEDSWSGTYSKLLPGSNLDSGFLSIYKLDLPVSCPIVILNTTCVQNGKRGLISNIALGMSFPGALDVFAETKRDIPLKTAASMSARFPYLTPSATIQNPESGAKFDLVDGGYADNSSLQSAMQIFLSLREIITGSSSADSALYARIVPEIIYIKNGGSKKNAKRSTLLHEVLTPLSAFMSAYGASGELIDSTVMQTMAASGSRDHFREISLDWTPGDDEASCQYPLGWYISQVAVDSMDVQVNKISWR